ncbi:MAG TPA: cytidylate kinase-like family protein [Anaerolineae bacterium]|nr:cytidylate kinase-like family protein [Anaerolineae bacterium]HMR66638.1 cytidylate kinase-like family protein [Anaerolineae bacterium]
MTVITISRQVGSEGMAIARQVARTLGYHVAGEEVMEWALRQYGLIQFKEVFERAPSFWDLFDEQFVLTADMLDRVIKALARHGDIVIIGRGSYAPLQGLADVVNARIQAPRPVRVQRMMARLGIDQVEAEARVAEEDRVHAGFIEKAYKVRSDDATPFDLVIDTGHMSPDFASGLIVKAVRARLEQAPGAAPTAAAFEVDGVLTGVINEALVREVSSP